MVAPVVEIAGNQQRRALRHLAGNPVDERIGLALAAAGKQAKVNHEAVDVALVDPNHTMKHTALFEGMVGKIAILLAHDRKPRQQRIAVMAMQIAGIASISRLEGVLEGRRARQKLVLRLARPLLETSGMLLVATLDLLQENQIGIQFMQARTQRMNTRDPSQAEELADYPLVDVVSRDPQGASR